MNYPNRRTESTLFDRVMTSYGPCGTPLIFPSTERRSFESPQKVLEIRGEGYWEIYIILLIAGILRLYRLDTSEFSGDQTFLLRLAYDAVHYGLIPATSNGSSIYTANAPMAVYFLMIPALFSPDPLWATVMTALFNVAAVLLTYIFTRRYFGRLAATIAALLYATAQTTIVFSRFIWQPNLIAPFTPYSLCLRSFGVL